MIKNLTIKNYKLFKDIEIKSISQFTLIGGKDDVGKTSLMEAMLISIDRGNPNIITDNLFYRGFSKLIPSAEYAYDPIFYNFDINNEINIHASIDDDYIGVNIKEILNNEISLPLSSYSKNLKINSVTNSLTQALQITFLKNGHNIIEQSKISLYPEIKYTLLHKSDAIDDGYVSDFRKIFINSSTRLTHNQQASIVSNLLIDKYKHKLIEFLQMISPKLIDIQTISDGDSNLLYVDIGKSKLIPLAFMGDGVNRLLNIIATMYLCQNGILFVDNIEELVHSSVFVKVWYALVNLGKDLNCQVIATVNNDEFLRLANEAMQEANLQNHDFAYIKLEKDGDGNNYVGAFDYELFNYAIENMEIR